MDDQNTPGADSSPSLNAKGAARRRFTKTGGALSGVILTMASRNGMAAAVTGATPSGFVSASANTAVSHVVGTDMLGLSPGYWKNHLGAWPGARTSTTAKFGEVFGCPKTNPLYNCTLLNIVSNQEPSKSADKDNVAMHIVASLLNVRTPRFGMTCLNEAKVREIWNGYLMGGYVPVLGAKPWNGAQIVVYLKSTMS